MKLATTVQAEPILVGLGELRTATTPEGVLISVGLGSCVALCLHDPWKHIAGMAHMVLPVSGEGRRIGLESKFVDRAVPLLLAEMERLGAGRGRMVAKLTGGAQMINGLGAMGQQHIGERNADAARAALLDLGLEVQSEDTGGRSGRTARFYAGTGKLVISLIGGDTYEL